MTSRTVWNEEYIKTRTGKTKEELRTGFGIIAETGIDKNAITFYVNDFSQYNALISFLNDNRSYGGDHLWSLFYRGVKDSSYELKSSLRVSGLERYESRIINDLYILHPHEFEGCKTDFEMIAKMRHYGLPTRFIDFSRNPNIALWVACEEFENKDGLIYVLSSQHDVLPVRMAEILCQFARFDDGFDMIDERAIYNQIGIDNLKYYIQNMWCLGGSMFFEPPRIDQREVNQESIFLAECNELYHVFWSNGGRESVWLDENNHQLFINSHFKKLPEHLLDDHLVCGSLKSVDSYSLYHHIRIVIPSASKESMLKELNYRGINRAFMYPTIDNSVEIIKKRYQNTNGSLEK